MDVTNQVLEDDVIALGFTADEAIRDGIVTLNYKGAAVKSFFGAKAKFINGTARMCIFQLNAHLEDCRQSLEAGTL